MANRLLPALFTFIVLVSCYLAYEALAVPALQGPPAATVEVMQPAQSAEPPQLFGNLIEPIFPEESWERSCEIILRNEQVVLFVGGYEQLDDHRLQISPCTIVLQPRGLDNAASEKKRTWIMQAPGKTILQMEKDADIRRGSLGRIVSAYIPGEVTVRSDETAPGAGDRIELVTSHLQIGTAQIWTPHDVRFRWGANFGAGSDLTIRFSDLHSGGGRIDRLTQALPADLRSIELVRLERLHIESPRDADAAPVEVTCDGPLKLDMLGGLARMHDDVRIERFVAGGRVDSLTCDELTARFARSPAIENKRASFQFERIVATGEPAIATSLQAGADASERRHRFATNRMEYDLESGEFVSGPGKYTTRAQRTGRESQDIEITWLKSMRWLAAEDGRLLVLEGPTRCAFGVNEILAERLRIWVDQPDVTPASHVKLATQPARAAGPTPTHARANPYRPRRVMADGHVRINTEQLVGSTERLDLIIRQPSMDTTGGNTLATDGASDVQLRPPQNRGGALASTAAAQRLQVTGQMMRLLVQQQAGDFNLRDVTLDGHVRCAAVEAANGSVDAASSFELLGATLLIRDLDQTGGVATVSGGPAKIRGRGVDISGPTINLDRSKNRVWIDGAGSATLPLPAAIAKRYPRDAAFAYVVWQNRMNFDGRTIACDRNVSIRGPAQMIRAEKLDIELDRFIDLSQTRLDEADFSVRRIAAGGGVLLENRTINERGLESIDTAAVETLDYEYQTQQVIGEGPGWLETVRMGKAVGALGNPAAASAASSSLIYVRVEFQRQMRANLALRQAEFSDRIDATYGPVRDWKDRIEARDARSLGDGQLLMNCDRLSLFQIRQGQPGKAPVEVAAQGNVSVEANQFAAQARRMSYDQGKRLFVIEGNDRTLAHLWRQLRPGAPRQEISARKILYSPATGAVHVDGMQMLDLSNLGAQ